MKVLIADDDRVLVRMLGAAFRNKGWEVVQAFDAMQALMFTKREPRPDVVLLDLGMPGGTGFGVLEKLTRSPSTADIPVVVVTGETDKAAEARARDFAVAAFLRKPVEPAEVVKAAEAAVEKPTG